MQAQTDYRFPVALEKAFTKDGIEIPRTRTIVRQDTKLPLSVVSDRYKLYTHEDVMNAVKPFVRELGQPETMFSLEKDGARLIATHTFRNHSIQLPRGHDTERSIGDVVALRLHIINSYNRSTALEFKLGGMVLRCLNGMTLFEHLFHLSFRHLGEAWTGELPRPQTVVSAFSQAGEQWKRLAEASLTPRDQRKLVEDAVKLQILPKRSFEAERVRFERAETYWDLYNAFTYVYTHTSKRMQVSGKLTRGDKLNVLFNDHLNGTYTENSVVTEEDND